MIWKEDSAALSGAGCAACWCPVGLQAVASCIGGNAQSEEEAIRTLDSARQCHYVSQPLYATSIASVFLLLLLSLASLVIALKDQQSSSLRQIPCTMQSKNSYEHVGVSLRCHVPGRLKLLHVCTPSLKWSQSQTYEGID